MIGLIYKLLRAVGKGEDGAYKHRVTVVTGEETGPGVVALALHRCDDAVDQKSRNLREGERYIQQKFVKCTKMLSTGSDQPAAAERFLEALP